MYDSSRWKEEKNEEDTEKHTYTQVAGKNELGEKQKRWYSAKNPLANSYLLFSNVIILLFSLYYNWILYFL